MDPLAADFPTVRIAMVKPSSCVVHATSWLLSPRATAYSISMQHAVRKDLIQRRLKRSRGRARATHKARHDGFLTQDKKRTKEARLEKTSGADPEVCVCCENIRAHTAAMSTHGVCMVHVVQLLCLFFTLLISLTLSLTFSLSKLNYGAYFDLSRTGVTNPLYPIPSRLIFRHPLCSPLALSRSQQHPQHHMRPHAHTPPMSPIPPTARRACATRCAGGGAVPETRTRIRGTQASTSRVRGSGTTGTVNGR